MSEFQLFALTIDNVHCDKCVTAIKSKIYEVLHSELEKFSKKDKLSNEISDSISDTIKVYTKDDVKDILYVQIPLALTVTMDLFVVIFDYMNESLMTLGYDIANVDEVTDKKLIKKKIPLHEENPFLDKYAIWKNHKNICNECTHSSDLFDSLKSHYPTSEESTEKQKSSDDEGKEDGEEEYELRAIINGITCTACTSTINSMCKELWYVISSNIDFITKIGVFKLKSNDPQIVDDLKENVEDCGYEFNLLDGPTLISTKKIDPEDTHFELQCAINGIYCAACVHTISNAIKNTPELEKIMIDFQINPITKIGNFTLKKFDDEINSLLSETIEDCGYDFELIGEVKQISSSNTLEIVNKKTRTISLKIENMYCDKCPLRVESAIKEKYPNFISQISFKWENPNTKNSKLDYRILKLSYKPSILDDLQVRSILATINSIEKLKATILEKENLQDHMNKIASKELKSIALRLSAALVFAIPSFVFGIVIMSLLPSDNKVKKHMDKKVIGNSNILMWVLFGVSTPVYFIIDLYFHKKAYKELRVLWKINILFNNNVSKNKSLLARFNWRIFLKRFFKFGSMSLLISLGTSVAYFASLSMLILSTQQKAGEQMYSTYFDSVTFLTLFLLVGKFLENYSKKKTIGMLNNLTVTNGHTTVAVVDQLNSTEGNIKYLTIPKNQLELNDIMLIKPGESPVVDGILLKNLSSDSSSDMESVITQFDESSLTGESLPCNKVANDPIFAGTINLTSPIHTQITNLSNLSKGSLLDKIVESITMGQLNKRADLEKTADKVTSFFVPVICFISLTVWFIWLGLGYSGKLPISYLCNNNDNETCSMSWSLFSISFSISVFVISCPCALGLAVPLSIFVGSGILAKHGILPKGGGMALQNCNSVDIVCFDKTGTLTNGEVTVVDEYILNEYKDITWDLLLGIETMSNHPLSFAVVNYINGTKNCKNDFNASELLGTVNEVAGNGLISSNGFLVGNENFLLKNGFTFNEEVKSKLLDWQMKGFSIITFGYGKKIILCLALADTIRKESIDVIGNLQSRNIEVYLLSGDNPVTAKVIGNELKIDNPDKHVRGGLLPEDKADIVKELSANGTKTVLMVGDGINDAPALSNAAVGVAISSISSSSKEKISSKTSDLALVSCDFAILQASFPLLSVLTLLDISRITLHRVYINLGWALVYNVIGIPIAAGILYEPLRFKLSPTWSAFAMAASSVSVVFSSTLLKFYRPRDYKKKFNLS
ncbi:hypothetical protein ACO0SA_004026 [Hanseniaspora valbyensis]